MTGRRGLTLAVAACAAAAGLALYAASRTWLMEIEVRAAPLPSITTARSGGSLVPALPALALVALAGAGGVLATRGKARVAVGVLLAWVGLVMGAAVIPIFKREDVATGWVLACAAAGLTVASVGLLTVRLGMSWPVMGTKYDRTRGSGVVDGGPADSNGPAETGLWDAIDRGEDPTKS